LRLVIGTYTEKLPHVDGTADGLLGAGFDADTGRFGPVTPLAAARNPTYAAFGPGGRHLYAVHETDSFQGTDRGGVTAYRYDPATGALDELNARPSGGDATCHLALDPSGRFVVVANQDSDLLVSFALDEDDSILTRVDTAPAATPASLLFG
jgi:6-phosphogluconolactonase